MSLSTTAQARPSDARTWSLPISFALAIAAQVVLFAGANLPTPLFPIYEERYGFGSGMVTVLFAVYVVALLPLLIGMGPMADRVGRRPLLAAGLAITAVSSAAFAAASSVAWLFAGEVIYGVGAGVVMSCVAVAIRELHPRADLAAGALAASVAAAAGLTLGPLASGLLAWITPWPTVTPYVVDIVAALVLAAALTRIPETRPRTGSLSSPRQRGLWVPIDIRRAFVPTALAAGASFMMVGWVFGLSSLYLHDELGIQLDRPVVAGSFAALVLLTNGTAQLLLRRHRSPGALHLALGGVVLGMTVMAASTITNSLTVAIAGAVVAGASSGVAQMNAMATMQHVVPAHARGTVMSAYFTVCYVALSAPVIIAGTIADYVGLGMTSAGYVVGLLIFVVTAIGLAARGGSAVPEPAVPIEPPVALPPTAPEPVGTQ